MRRERIPLPRPRSSFVLVQCTNCGNEQTLFTSTTVPIKCKVCDALIAEATGGRAKVTGVVLRRLD